MTTQLNSGIKKAKEFFGESDENWKQFKNGIKQLQTLQKLENNFFISTQKSPKVQLFILKI